MNPRYLSKREFKKMLTVKDYWMDVEELCKRKIATHVNINGKLLTAKKKYLKQYEK